VPELRYSVHQVVERNNILDQDEPVFAADFRVSM